MDSLYGLLDHIGYPARGQAPEIYAMRLKAEASDDIHEMPVLAGFLRNIKYVDEKCFVLDNKCIGSYNDLPSKYKLVLPFEKPWCVPQENSDFGETKEKEKLSGDFGIAAKSQLSVIMSNNGQVLEGLNKFSQKHSKITLSLDLDAHKSYTDNFNSFYDFSLKFASSLNQLLIDSLNCTVFKCQVSRERSEVNKKVFKSFLRFAASQKALKDLLFVEKQLSPFKKTKDPTIEDLETRLNHQSSELHILKTDLSQANLEREY